MMKNLRCIFKKHRIDKLILEERKDEDHPFKPELNNKDHVIRWAVYIMYCVDCGRKLKVDLHIQGSLQGMIKEYPVFKRYS